MRSLLVHLTTVGIGIAQHVSGKLYHHHLHAKADAEGGYVVRAGVVGGNYLALYASLSEARAYHYAVLALELFGHVILGDVL